MSNKKEKKGLNIGVKSFITAIGVLFLLMVLTYGLTFIVPGSGIPFWKWALSPVLVLGAEGNVSLIAVIIFLLIIGGVFNSLDRCGLMKYMLDKITWRYGKNRKVILFLVPFFFMAMGSLIGSFEEAVPLTPIVVALAIRLGWDAMTGMGMSLLAIGCGFAAGVCNPFTIGVAQELAGLPMFSGIWLRAVSFVAVYLLLMAFLTAQAKKVERPIFQEEEDERFLADAKMDKGLLCFGGILGAGILIVLSSVFVSALQDYTMIIVAVMFLAAGITSGVACGMGRHLGRTFVRGAESVVPGVLMILMANSIKYTMEEAGILEMILEEAIQVAGRLPGWAVVLFIYLIVLVLNFFISSGSAKAFLLIPLIVPVAEAFGISSQLCILAYAFGDGFSNVFYPTNPVLLIGLGIVGLDYGKWVRWSWKFQAMNLILTSLILLFGLVVGY